MSFCSSVSCIGAMIGPFIPQVSYTIYSSVSHDPLSFRQKILPADENAAVGIHVYLSVVTMVAAILLPIETKVQAMRVSYMKSSK